MTFEEYVNEHGSVVIRSNVKKKVNDIFECLDIRGSIINQPFKVVREATAEEYISQDSKLTISSLWPYYYEVRTD